MNRGLTSFRALAFLAVFLFHNDLFQPGTLGVQAFFVLSGFLLTPILVDTKAQLPTRLFFINFYGRRVLRIFPLYYGYLLALVTILLLFALTHPGGASANIARLLAQMPWAFTYTYNFFCATAEHVFTPLLTPLWSLAVEEQFYLVWPVLIFLVPRKYLKTFLLATIGSGPVWRWGITLLAESGKLTFLANRVDSVVSVLPFSGSS